MLKEVVVKNKLAELLGTTPSDLQLGITQRILEGLIGYPLDLNDYEEDVEFIGSPHLFVSNLPLVQVQSVTLHDVEVPFVPRNKRSITVKACAKAASYEKFRSAMHKLPGDIFHITYSAGWTPDNFPDDLIYVAYRLLVSKFSNQSIHNLSSYKIDTIAYAYRASPEFDDEIRGALSEYIK